MIQEITTYGGAAVGFVTPSLLAGFTLYGQYKLIGGRTKTV
jgi:hypothetical protein